MTFFPAALLVDRLLLSQPKDQLHPLEGMALVLSTMLVVEQVTAQVEAHSACLVSRSDDYGSLVIQFCCARLLLSDSLEQSLLVVL